MQRLARSAQLVVLLALPATLRAQPALTAATTIGKIDSIWSPTLKEGRKFLVYLPPSYRDSTFLPQTYPVLYLLDGEAHFHSVSGLIQILATGVNGTFVVPEMIVVAITNTDRTRDMTPTHTEKDPTGKPAPFMKTSGGMAAFFQFMKSELLPRIDSDYRAAPYRVFVGHSLGGITTINALYTIPETFNAYVAIDPSLWWDGNTLLKKARDYFSTPGLAGKALFVGQANTIDATDTIPNQHFSAIVQFNGVLESYNQSGLRYGYKYYADDNHGSVPLAAEYDALRFIFSTYKVDFTRSLDQPSSLTAHFARVTESLGYQMLPPERMVNLLGRVEMQRDTTKAIELFQLNADLYPASYNAWSALGDGWAARGDTKKAIAAYERSLALNAKDLRASTQIKKLGEKKP